MSRQWGKRSSAQASQRPTSQRGQALHQQQVGSGAARVRSRQAHADIPGRAAFAPTIKLRHDGDSSLEGVACQCRDILMRVDGIRCVGSDCQVGVAEGLQGPRIVVDLQAVAAMMQCCDHGLTNWWGGRRLHSR